MVDEKPNRLPSFPWIMGGVAMTLLIVGIFSQQQNETVLTHVALTTRAPSNADALPPARFATTIRRPKGPPTIELTEPDPQGRIGSVACTTCHSVRDPNFANRTPADLDQFHQNMPMAHGSLACYSCHNPEDADTLRLADTTVVEYPDVMTLCAQCHASQAKAYEHGAHGGMNGYWDLTRGPRTRNNCIDCHDPHVPKFPSMQPTFKPHDRFLTTSSEASHE